MSLPEPRHVGLELDRGLVVADVLALRVLIGVRAQRRPALAQRLLIAAEVGLATGGSGRRARGRGGTDGQRIRRHRQEGQQREHGRTKSLHRSVPSVRSAKPPQREQPQPAGRDVPRHLGPGRVSRPDVRAASRGPSVAEIWSLAPPPFPHPPAPPGPSGAGSLAPPAGPAKLPSWIRSLTQPQGPANPLRRLQGTSLTSMLRLGETHDMSSIIATTEARPRWSRGHAVAVAGTVGPVALITIAGAVLRLWSFDRVGANPFYDAAVRSMSLSWHNFFFGAFEPGAQVSVDKAPADLWLQVASIKLFGFTDVAMRVPEVAGGILAIPLLYDLVRRLFGHVAGIAAAATLAVLPAAILTAHSDTMDSVMMALRRPGGLARGRRSAAAQRVARRRRRCGGRAGVQRQAVRGVDLPAGAGVARDPGRRGFPAPAERRAGREPGRAADGRPGLDRSRVADATGAAAVADRVERRQHLERRVRL